MPSFPQDPSRHARDPRPLPVLIGPYRIDRELARGGMGVVYLAHDTRLDRTVALKALPEDVASEPERLQRFEREARLLASLNHPNVATIYGIESAGGRRYIALEYIDGESLAARLARGPLTIEETIEIGVQVAAGIEAAHEAGIIHRDLKPANVVLAAGDRIKVVDFGLAKGRDGDTAASQADSPAITPSSPTISLSPAEHTPTVPGIILGTAPYLSPEQARGKPVDRRTDIWSFGCVLYECLTGAMAFRGETVSDTISIILRGEPDWHRLPEETPPALLALLRRCLVKDPRRRLRDIGEAQLALEDIRVGDPGIAATSPPAAMSPAATGPAGLYRRLRIPLLLAGVVGFLFAAAFWNLVLNKPDGSVTREVTRLSIPLPSDLRVPLALITSDGRSFVILGIDRNPEQGKPPHSQIYIRHLNDTRYEPLRGTERSWAFVLSPDGKWIEYVANASERSSEMRMFKVPVDGSAPPIAVSTVEESWARPVLLHSGDQLIPFANGKEYVRLPASGGPASSPISFGSEELVHDFTSVLPGDRGVLLVTRSFESSASRTNLSVLDLKSGETKLLVPDAGMSQYSSTGHILFQRGDALLAVPFDADALEVTGPPVAMLDGLRMFAGYSFSSLQLTRTGTLVYLLGGDVSKDRQAVLVGGDGTVSEWSPERQPYLATLSASPDGKRFAFHITVNGINEIWISERGGDRAHRLVAVPGSHCGFPVWSPDGNRVAFYQEGRDERAIYVIEADGTSVARRVAKVAGSGAAILSSWSPDGGVLLATRYDAFRGVLCALDVSAAPEAELQPLFGAKPGIGWTSFSPDGRRIAYTSDEAGREEVFVSGWDTNAKKPSGRAIQVSRTGGTFPRWSRDGSRLFFHTPENKILVATISRGPGLSATSPVAAWDLDKIGAAVGSGSPFYDVLPDGRLLVIRRGAEEDDVTRYEVALNFDEEVKAKFK